MVAPNRTAHDICKHLSSNFKPKLEIGKACSQSKEFFAATASNLALFLSVVFYFGPGLRGDNKCPDIEGGFVKLRQS